MRFASQVRWLSAAKDGEKPQTLGAIAAISAYLVWGLLPLYWKRFDLVPPGQVLDHRILWSAILTIIWLAAGRKMGLAVAVVRDLRRLGFVTLTALLLASNWYVYIWAIQVDRVLETSLGYFITPLVNVALGTLFLRERLRFWQWVAVAIACLGVANECLHVKSVPWVALSLALTFSVYGLLKKISHIAPVTALAVEMSILCPFALGHLAYAHIQGTGAFRSDPTMDTMLVLTGAATALPLVWFSYGARRLKFSTLGLFQYLSPSCQFVLATVVFQESLSLVQLITFASIWTALLIFVADGRRQPAPEAPKGTSS
ncbi:MAG: EamA family transporter RarD [Myxococcales bacterium]|nr:EamA family transporter RarD [Myxococcales bacterium]